MLVRLGLKVVALLAFFFIHYLLYSALIVLLAEVLKVDRNPQLAGAAG